MTVGMTTEISLLVEHPLLIIGGAALLILIKAIVMTGIARYKKYNWNTSLMIGACLAQGGEFAFVVLNVARSEKVLTTAITEPAILIVTISMVLTPIVFGSFPTKLCLISIKIIHLNMMKSPTVIL